jgi:enoyl-CoA hydratase/carnithine racemase
MADDLVRIETADRVATLTLDNPPVNAVSMRLFDALHAAMDRVEEDRGVRAVILAGAGTKAFCAGADLRE